MSSEAGPSASSLRRLAPGASASFISCSTLCTARTASGTYLARLRCLSFRALTSSCFTSLTLSCEAHCCSAWRTALWNTAMSPMYSLEVPLKGILVLTMLTNIPSLESSAILNLPHLMLFAVLVITSFPPSNRRGMRLAKRNTLICPGSTVWSRPPRDTAASTTKAWPSCVRTSPWKVATICGCSSFITPSRRLYSPAGDSSLPPGSANLTCFSSWCRRSTWPSLRSRGCVSAATPAPSSATSRWAYGSVMLENSLCRNCGILRCLEAPSMRLSSSRSTHEGWCLPSLGGSGMASVRRRNSLNT
mmetsp:Transcript_27363/g.76415  ORF Transcript_27363/g.76415 Transcript_27363/m.76415 type:complete len:304 (+) Transcript_27363:925-1836(+)